MVGHTARSLLLGVVTAGALAGCVATNRTSAAGGTTSSAGNAGAGSRSSAAWADSVLATLSLRDRAAQMVWPWVLGDYAAVDDPTYRRVERLVREQRVGGIIISVGSPTEIAVKLNMLQQASALPLLVGADLETGAAFRARGGYFLPNAIDLGGATYYPYQMGIGATRDTTFAYEMGRVTAREGRALGIHMAFAPVLDVNNNPKNPVISLRSFGENAQLVSQLGAAFVRGIQENGMLATGKHFPGHGDTEQNSHLELSRVSASAARLDSVELAPFRAAVQAGVRGIMTFHGVLPGLDTSSLPATLNPRIMTDLLRGKMGFRGLVITDALDMNGVLGKMTMAEVTQRAVAAGNDVLLMPTDMPGAIDAVVDGVRRGLFTEARINESVRKLLIAKHEMGLARQRLTDVQAMRTVVGDSTNVATARMAAERAITLVRGLAVARAVRTPSGHVTRRERHDRAAHGSRRGRDVQRRAARTSSHRFAASEPHHGAGLRRDRGSSGRRATSARAGVHRQPAASARAGARRECDTRGAGRGHRDRVVVLRRELLDVAAGSHRSGWPTCSPVCRTAGRRWCSRRSAIRTSQQSCPRRPPIWSHGVDRPLMQRAAARALLGLAPITGQLPITIPSVAAYGAGLAP